MRSRRLIVACLAALALVARSASAFTFALVGGGSDQTLIWRWETNSQHCTTCGGLTSANAKIPLDQQTFPGGRAGGLLDWTASSGRLTLVAMPIAWAFGSTPTAQIDAWGSVDARTPPTFAFFSDPGDPISADLIIRPRIVGTVERIPGVGGFATTWLRMSQAVIYNGVTVTSDSLERDETNGGTSYAGPVSFPNGVLNNVVLHGVFSGSTFTIPVWAYMRAIVQGQASVDAFSSSGNGLAVEVDIRDVNAVGVDPPPAPALALSARPNPASGFARFECRLPVAARVRLTLHDVAGHRIATLVDAWEPAGIRDVRWNGRDGDGNPAPSGVYFAQLDMGDARRSQKLVWMGP